MKIRFCAIAAALLLVSPALVLGDVVDPFANVLIKYDFNQLTGDCDSNVPAYCAPCVWTTDLSLNSLSQGLSYGGPDGTQFRSFSGWDRAYDYSFSRSDLSQEVRTLSYDVFVRDDMIAEISGVCLDWQRPWCSSVDSIQASIFWEDAAGAVQYRTSGQVALNGVGSWSTLNLDFSSGSSALPAGAETSGRQFHVELYAWGQDGDALYLDNVLLKGVCAPIPEPNGALLIAAAGVALLLRRRGRA